MVFPYDTYDYANSLAHLGKASLLPDWPVSFVRCPIPGTDLYDALAPWPYCTPPGQTIIKDLCASLKEKKIVTFRAFFRPDGSVPIKTLKKIGFKVFLLKEHFGYHPSRQFPDWSAKTRMNIRRAKRHWEVRSVSLAEHWETIAYYHDDLVKRRNVSRIASPLPYHFKALSKLDGFVTLGALDRDGLGAALIVAKDHNSIHFHTIVGSERAYKKRGFYALYATAIEMWGKSHTIYLGGVPNSKNGPGIAAFKQRFSNMKIPVFMAYIVLDSQECDRLSALLGESNWLPPYRKRGE